MTTLTLEGRAFPNALVGNIAYSPVVLLDGRPVTPEKWTLTAGASEIVNRRALISFTPVSAEPHTLHVTVFNEAGYLEEAVYTFNVSMPGTGTVDVGVRWDKPSYNPGDSLKGTIYIADPEGTPPQSVAWTLYRNAVIIATGNSTAVGFAQVEDGVYRLAISVRDARNVLYRGESAFAVNATYESQSAIVTDPTSPSCVYTGAIYTARIKGSAGSSTSLPYQLASLTQSLILLPGTTHVEFELEPDSLVDDEVVVRTQTGNWTLRGYPTGLYNEQVGYDYRPRQLIPAPADQKLKITVDAFNVHGSTYTAFDFRVRVKCYVQTATMYRYTQCPYSIMPGGPGGRSRKLAILFSEIDVQLDVDSDADRYGTDQATLTYTTPIATSLPGSSLNPSGEPYPSQNGLTYGEGNRYAIYECPGYAEVDALAVAASENVRPFLMTLQMPGVPPIIQRIKRVGGTMGIYLANGGLNAGTVVTVRVQRGNGQSNYSFTVPSDVYVNSATDYLRIGSVSLGTGISDFQFDFNGLVAYIEFSEPASVNSGTLPLTIPAWGSEQIIAGTFTPLVHLDGACYSRPERVAAYSQEIFSVKKLEGSCGNEFCGPVGLYCYTRTCAPGTHSLFKQPYLYPSPYIALGTNLAECYSGPMLVAEGTVVPIGWSGSMAAAGSVFDVRLNAQIVPVDFCGTPYRYIDCRNGNNIAVVYPCDTAPHAYVGYQQRGYYAAGTLATFGTLPVVRAESVLPAFDCTDPVCTGSNASGNSYAYWDSESGSRVNVRFERLDLGVPFMGAGTHTIVENYRGLEAGLASICIDSASKYVMTAPGAGELTFSLNLLGLPKKLIRTRGSLSTTFTLGAHETEKTLPVALDDRILLDLSTPYGNLSRRISGQTVVVRWVPNVVMPWCYDTYQFNHSGTIQALGFCGLSNRSAYTVYETVPADAQQSGAVVNPDSIVTVQGRSGSEYVLLRNRGLGESAPPLPSGLSWYSAQFIQSPALFRFYAARSVAGAHGEMDVWLNTNGTFPTHFKASPYRVLFNGTDSFRCDSTVDDTSRNSLRVVSSSHGLHMPSVYTDTAGRVVSIHSKSGTIVSSAGTFTRQTSDPGVSYNVEIPGETGWFAVISDFHGRSSNPDGIEAVDIINAWNPEYVVSCGDNLDVTNADLTVGQINTWFWNHFQKWPFYSAIGNHDRYSPQGLALLRTTTLQPANYYDVVKGDIHWFIVDCGYMSSHLNVYTGKYVDEESTGEFALTVQGQWLRRRLAESNARYRVVVIHQPPYSSNSETNPRFPQGYREYKAMRVPYRSWGADLVIFGHNHMLERLVGPDGCTYLNCSPAGASYMANFAATPTPNATSVVRYAQHHGQVRGRITADGLRFEWWDQHGVARDIVVIPPRR